MYDEIAPNNLMGYHVMYPVEELLDYCSREFRAPMDAFDGIYQQFIKTDPAPVYVARARTKSKDHRWRGHSLVRRELV